MNLKFLYLVLLIGITVGAKIDLKNVTLKFFEPKYIMDQLGITKEVNSKKPNLQMRVIGGKNARPHQFPYQVAIMAEYENSDMLCGGTLIANNFVLTAAHCLEDAYGARVYFGAHNYTNDQVTGKKEVYVEFEDFIIHEDYNTTSVENDIALLRLPEQITPNEYVQIIKLDNDKNANLDHVRVRITGWGYTSHSKDDPDVLQYANLFTMPNAECKFFFRQFIKPTNVCSDSKRGISTAKGDSGGPLVDTKRKVQIGLTSFSIKDSKKSFPSVYTRISHYYDWIQERMNEEPSYSNSNESDYLL